MDVLVRSESFEVSLSTKKLKMSLYHYVTMSLLSLTRHVTYIA